MKVLIVDDAKLVHSFITAILQNGFADVQVSSAFNGQEALDKVAEMGGSFFDVILIDWEMPGLDGPATIGKLMDNGVTTPILMITTKTMSHHEEQMLKAGVKGFVRKPFREADLVAYIKSIVSNSCSN